MTRFATILIRLYDSDGKSRENSFRESCKKLDISEKKAEEIIQSAWCVFDIVHERLSIKKDFEQDDWFATIPIFAKYPKTLDQAKLLIKYPLQNQIDLYKNAQAISDADIKARSVQSKHIKKAIKLMFPKSKEDISEQMQQQTVYTASELSERAKDFLKNGFFIDRDVDKSISANAIACFINSLGFECKVSDIIS